MKKGWKIFFIVIGVFFLIAALVIGPTIYQGAQIAKVINDESLRADIEALKSGDCSKLQEVEQKYSILQTKLKEGCKNPVLKTAMEQYAQKAGKNITDVDLCAITSDPNSPIYSELNQMRQNCNQSN